MACLIMVRKQSTIEVTTEYLVLHSETPCPECGKKEWIPYIYEFTTQDFVPIEASVINIDIDPVIDEPYDNFSFDECLNCGIAISSCSDTSAVFARDHYDEDVSDDIALLIGEDGLDDITPFIGEDGLDDIAPFERKGD